LPHDKAPGAGKEAALSIFMSQSTEDEMNAPVAIGGAPAEVTPSRAIPRPPEKPEHRIPPPIFFSPQ